MRRAKVYMHEKWAGTLTENETGYYFQYRKEYLEDDKAEAVSLILPLQKASFQDKVLFPFFDGLIPEGWLLEIVEKNWKINPRDRMGLLLNACHDCIGAVSIMPFEGDEE